MTYLVGYDCRVCTEEILLTAFPAQARQGQLINPFIPLPYTVDTTVWPSAFTYEADRPSRILNAVPLDHNDWRHHCFYLWSDLQDMLQSFGAHKELAKKLAALPIAITASKVFFPQDPRWLDVESTGVLDSEFSSEWRCVGFDAADAFLLSGLTGIGLDSDVREKINQRWAPFVNEYGLLPDEGEAAEYAREIGAQVLEHAPFAPMGIWIQKTSSLR
jgi:hypothetical protein